MTQILNIWKMINVISHRRKSNSNTPCQRTGADMPVRKQPNGIAYPLLRGTAPMCHCDPRISPRGQARCCVGFSGCLGADIPLRTSSSPNCPTRHPPSCCLTPSVAATASKVRAWTSTRLPTLVARIGANTYCHQNRISQKPGLEIAQTRLKPGQSLIWVINVAICFSIYKMAI